MTAKETAIPQRSRTVYLYLMGWAIKAKHLGRPMRHSSGFSFKPAWSACSATRDPSSSKLAFAQDLGGYPSLSIRPDYKTSTQINSQHNSSKGGVLGYFIVTRSSKPKLKKDLETSISQFRPVKSP